MKDRKTEQNINPDDERRLTIPQFEELCEHVPAVGPIKPTVRGCEECLKMGASWVHLRVCLICGHVGCCDQSQHKHATAHYNATGHEVIQSFEPGEDWLWCYVDELPFFK